MGQRLIVFVVEEYLTLRDIAMKTLEGLDFEVECFQGPDVIVRLRNANKGSPAVMFLAASASRCGEDGLSLFEQIRRLDREVIIMATSGWSGIAEEMAEADPEKRTFPCSKTIMLNKKTLRDFLIGIATGDETLPRSKKAKLVDEALLRHLCEAVV